MQSSAKTASATEHLVSSVASSASPPTVMMIPSREEGHHVSLSCVTSSSQQQQQQPLTNVKQVNLSSRHSWQDLSQYSACQTVPHSHQERTTRHAPADFTAFSGGYRYQDQSRPRNEWTGFEPNTWSHGGRTTYQNHYQHSDPHGQQLNSTPGRLSFYYANYCLVDDEQRFLQGQNNSTENSGTSSMFFPSQGEYNEHPTVDWISQPTSLPTPAADINRTSLIHSSGIFQAPAATGVLDIGGEGNSTSRSLYRQTCKSYSDDDGNFVVAISSSSSSSLSASSAAAAASKIIARRSGESSAVLTSSLTSSSQSQRSKAVTSEYQNASSSIG